MKFWTSDGRLDVVVLGPMTGSEDEDEDEDDVKLSANCEVIKEVADAVLAEACGHCWRRAASPPPW
ncbi:hypothetical protein [Variovorax sp. J22R115]|uniref:hypothetical protein n=1 Tax=Variovorax sp. J22R115 TaxID=3053509 RepID=UPI002578BA26|nr:hypothetical protein [Variovorax sp. J22R115]MDM0053611.1 hypothetical protein [Variovorax sp. J22R115]